jgi:hypothetical protein
MMPRNLMLKTGLVFAAALGASCAPDSVAPTPAPDPSHLYWALTLDHQAVTLSTQPPYDTLRLTATPRTSSGAVLSDAPAPTFISTDIVRLQVDSTGLLHAHQVGTDIVVLVTDTVDDIVHSGMVLVNVTDTAPPPVLAALSIHPIPPDSAKVALQGGKTLAALTTDSAGNPIDRVLRDLGLAGGDHRSTGIHSAQSGGHGDVHGQRDGLWRHQSRQRVIHRRAAAVRGHLYSDPVAP